MVPSRNVYHSVSEIETKFNSEDLTVPYGWTSKWDNNAQDMIDLIKSEWKS